jgi:hypothetical protein
MAAHIMQPKGDVFTVIVSAETTEEFLAEQFQVAHDWLLNARETEERKAAAQAAYDAIMAGESE